MKTIEFSPLRMGWMHGYDMAFASQLSVLQLRKGRFLSMRLNVTRNVLASWIFLNVSHQQSQTSKFKRLQNAKNVIASKHELLYQRALNAI
eukprot:15327161-Ditylum_brightwellii.AAC.1